MNALDNEAVTYKELAIEVIKMHGSDKSTNFLAYKVAELVSQKVTEHQMVYIRRAVINSVNGWW